MLHLKLGSARITCHSHQGFKLSRAAIGRLARGRGAPAGARVCVCVLLKTKESWILLDFNPNFLL